MRSVTRMRSVLCFGDSNTHGTVPRVERQSRGRHPWGVRWTSLLDERLGDDWRVIEEGHPSRTTVHADPIDGAHKNGLAVLPAILESHRPLDAAIVMLGTNDLKRRFSPNPRAIGLGVERIGQRILATEWDAASGPDGTAPRLLIVAPPPIMERGPFERDEPGAHATSLGMGAAIGVAAARLGTAFLDLDGVVTCDPADGVHYDADGHAAIARAIGDAFEAIIAGGEGG